MNTKEQDKHRCSKCRHYEGYYYKGYCEFYISGWGYCSKHDKSIMRTDSCEFWAYRNSLRRINNNKVLRVMTKALTDISALQQIFIEERQDR